ncbi:MAG: hypothetical protein JSV96_10845 [Candidatus Aminicenantes bacterium]|nr:MAG: hypothetical protein JSV96_10845 [Candidatus Aminicenantes bacterium]
MKRSIFFLSGLILAVLFFSYCSKEEVETKNTEQIYKEEGVPLRVEQVVAQEFKSELSFHSILSGIQESSAYATFSDEPSIPMVGSRSASALTTLKSMWAISGEHDLLEKFENSRLCKMIRHPQDYGICETFRHMTACGGGCRAAALALTGSLDGQDMSCPVWKGENAKKTNAHKS